MNLNMKPTLIFLITITRQQSPRYFRGTAYTVSGTL